MTSLLQDLRSATRSLRKSPMLVFVAFTTLSLGAGASTAIFSVVRGAILEPWPYAEADRIVTVRRNVPQYHAANYGPFSAPEVFDVLARTDVFERGFAGNARNVNLSAHGRPERLHGAALTASAFDMLGVAPELGRVFTEAEDIPGGPRVLVLSHRLWQSRYAADPAIVGRTIDIEGERYTVLGVMPRRFVFWDAFLYFPIQLDRRATDRQDRNLAIQARLARGVGPESAAAALESLVRRWEREHGADAPEYAGSHFQVASLKRGVLRDVQPALLVLAAGAGLAFLIAAVNIASLLLARAASRDREIAVRIALGASRRRIIGLFLLEGMLLALPGGALGLAAAAAATPALLSLIPYGYIPAEADVRLTTGVAVYGGLMALSCGLLLGLTPLLRRSGADPLGPLRESSSRQAGDRRGRRARGRFVTAQVAVSIVVLSGSGLLLRSMQRLLAIPMGFAAEGVQTARVPLPAGDSGRARAFVSETLRRIGALPGTASCGAVTFPPLFDAPSRTVVLEGLSDRTGNAAVETDLLAASPGYFETLRIPVKRGRPFREADRADAPLAASVNQAFTERYFAGLDPIGRRVRLASGAADRWMTVVGVVGDVRQTDLEREPRPALYVPVDQVEPLPPTVALVVRTPASAERAQAGIRQAVSSLDPGLPVYRPASLSQIVSDSLGGRRLAAVLLTAFGAVALALTALGSAALASYSVAQRRREIAVRMALGARQQDIARLFLAETGARVGAGLAGGVLLSYASARALSALLFGVSAHDPAILAGAALLLSATTLGATSLPARRAARVDPMTALRHE
jgi:putative ABC transport system permease protein